MFTKFNIFFAGFYWLFFNRELYFLIYIAYELHFNFLSYLFNMSLFKQKYKNINIICKPKLYYYSIYTTQISLCDNIKFVTSKTIHYYFFHALNIFMSAQSPS